MGMLLETRFTPAAKRKIEFEAEDYVARQISLRRSPGVLGRNRHADFGIGDEKSGALSNKVPFEGRHVRLDEAFGRGIRPASTDQPQSPVLRLCYNR
jgi:hypothetical protein